MRTFLLRRLLFAIPVLLGILVLNFALLHVPRARPLPKDLLSGPRLDAERVNQRIADWRRYHGLDDPLYVSFPRWLGRAATLDFGESFHEPTPVLDEIVEALGPTLLLQGVALVSMFLLGVPLGVLMARRARGPLDRWLGTSLYALYAVPAFWLATLLLVYAASEAKLFPLEKLASRGAEELGLIDRLLDTAHHLVLPVLVLTAPGLVLVVRQTRAAMLEALTSDYIRTARAAGLRERTVVWRYALRNSLIPLATLLGGLLPALVGGSVVVETIFNINGMGRLAWDATFSRDYPVLQAVLLLTALLTLAGYLLSDLLAAALDPRVRLA